MHEQFVIIELDHENSDLYSHEFLDEDDAKKCLQELEEANRKCYCIKISVPNQCADGLKVEVMPYT